MQGALVDGGREMWHSLAHHTIMFSLLADKLDNTFRKLRGLGKISEKNIADALRDIRLALLEADVEFGVAREFIGRVKERAMGQEVLKSIKPGEQIVKIFRDEIAALLGLLPGFGKIKKQLPDGALDPKRMKHMEAIVLSMTAKERSNPNLLNPSRRRRIAAGCGRSLMEVNKLIKNFSEMRKMMSGKGKMGAMMKQMGAMKGKGGKMPGLPGMGGGLGGLKGLGGLGGGLGGLFGGRK